MSRSGKYLARASMLAVVWAIIASLLGPMLIERGYRGESFGVVNSAFGGRDVHDVGFYLDAWYAVARAATLAFFALVILGLVLVRYPESRKKQFAKVLSGPGQVPGSTVLWLALLAGLLTGLGEATYQGLRHLVTQRPAANFYSEIFWMAPLSCALTTVAIGAAMVTLSKIGDVLWDVGKSAGIFVFLGGYALLQQEGVPLHPLSSAVLATGIAVLVGRRAAIREESVSRIVLLSRPYQAVFAVGLALLGWWGLPAVAEERARADRGPAPDGAPNIIVVIWDTVRAASLSLYGYERGTTPRLDAWAESATVFEAAIATAPWTLPTHGSVFTGRYNFDMRTSFFRPLDERFPTLAEVLTDYGYATGGFTANYLYTTDASGLDRGFDRWEDHVVGVPLFLESSWLSRSVARRIGSLPSLGYTVRKDAALVSDQLVEWASAQRRPFFAFLNVFDAHSPYEIPSAQAKFEPLPSESWATFKSSWQSNPEKDYTPEDTHLWVNRYDNAISYIDDELGRMLDTLESRGLLENTIVAVTSDHGESWGENGQLEHAQSLYIQTLHVPLVLWYPTKVPGDQRIAQAVSLRDVPATLLHLAGLDGSAVGGRSLVPLWTDGATPDQELALSELLYDPIDSRPWNPVSRGDMQSLIGGGYHYIRNGDGTEELYSWREDSLEQRNLANEVGSDAILAKFRSALDSIVDPG